MASTILDALKAQVEETRTVMGSAKALIDGFQVRMQAAIDAAVANGATAAELAPVQDEVNALKTDSDALAASVAANP